LRTIATFLLLFAGPICLASLIPKDTLYTNVNALMKEVRSTKNKTATYYLVLKDGDEEDVKIRIDLKQIDCEIPLFNSPNLDIKKLLKLTDENVTDSKQKLAAFDTKSREKIILEKELRQLNTSLNKLMAVDSLLRDSLAIDSVQKLRNLKAIEVNQKRKEAKSLYDEYDKMMDTLLGNLRTQYTQRLNSAIEEAYQKLENKETEFTSIDDDGIFYDIRLNLLKVDATREMLVPRRVNNQNTTEKVTSGKQYYVLHFAEFGSMFEEKKVKKVFSAIKLWEFHLNPFLGDKQYGLVCDDQERTQHYINSVVDFKNYTGRLEEEDNSRFENIFLEDVQWVSQIDDMYKGTSCWKWTCCNRASNEILEKSGARTDRTMQVVIAKSSQQDCGNITMVTKEKFEEGIAILKTSLKEHKLPMLIGVHHPKPVKNEKGLITGWEEECSGNTPQITNHYVIVVGMGFDEDKQQNYFRFYEVGTSIKDKGTSQNNRLLLDEKLNVLKGVTEYQSNTNYYYILTEIRKNYGKSYN
jgi:hypothetical protein